MKVKIDTKEKFHVITVEEPFLAANMTGEITKTLLSFLDKTPKNLIINFENVEKIDAIAANTILTLQQTFYNQLLRRKSGSAIEDSMALVFAGRSEVR